MPPPETEGVVANSPSGIIISIPKAKGESVSKSLNLAISTKSPRLQELELRDAAKICDLGKLDSILGTNPGLVNAMDGGGVTPIKNAARYGCLDVFNSLVAKGANINIKDSNGVTPLIAAAANGRKEIAELLLAKGVNINSKSKEGLNPLHYALYSDQKEMAEMLIGKGCDIKAKNRH